MNREFLRELGIEKEQEDKIMAEYGKSVESYKDQTKQDQKKIKNLEEEIEKTEGWEERFEKLDGDNKSLLEEMQGQEEEIERLTKELANKDNEYRLNNALNKVNAHNPADLKAFISLDDLEFEEDGIKGLENQIESLKESKAYLFKPEEENPQDESTDSPRFKGSPLPEGQKPTIKEPDERDKQKQLGKELAEMGKGQGQEDNNPFKM